MFGGGGNNQQAQMMAAMAQAQAARGGGGGANSNQQAQMMAAMAQAQAARGGGGGANSNQQAQMMAAMAQAQAARGGGGGGAQANPQMMGGMRGQQQQGGGGVESLFNGPFLQNYSAFMSTDPAAFGPHIQKMLDVVRKGELKGTPHAGVEFQIFQMINKTAQRVPEEVYPHLNDIYSVGFPVENADSSVSQIIDACARVNQPQAREKCLALLGNLIMEPALRPLSVSLVLMHIMNQCTALGHGNEKLLDSYMPKIREYKGASSASVTAIENWYAGRSLQQVDKKVDALESKIEALNGEFGAACANMDEVSKLMDKKIAEVKDFVGEIVKKLPQPCKLVVLGSVRKTLQLHFACAKTGNTVTTETKDWNSWCKVGFGLVKLGKCAVTAAAGNPMQLVAGVGAIGDIYKAYKSKDDEDFNKFIQEPFLTSAESDRLINQLRAGGFFEKMKYDNQLGDWVMINPSEGNVTLAVAQDAPLNSISGSGSSKAKKSSSGWFGGGSKKASSEGGEAAEGGLSVADIERISALKARVAELNNEAAQLEAEVTRLSPLEEKFLKLEARVIRQLKMSEGAGGV